MPIAGFVSSNELRKTRRLLIGCDGAPDTGKTEFALSAPGPGLAILLDRGIDGLLDNPSPPSTRQKNWQFKVVKVPKATQMDQAGYLKYWQEFYFQSYIPALDDAGTRSILIDGDSDSWELQRLAEFGRIAQVPQNLYSNVNAARRAMYARAHDAGKIVIATNKIKKVYVTKYGPDGKPELNSSGNEVRVWNGDYERQGFADQEYLWSIQLRHLYEPEKGWGVRITKCKADRSMEVGELWGDECNFQSLVQTIYPHISLEEWGYR